MFDLLLVPIASLYLLIVVAVYAYGLNFLQLIPMSPSPPQVRRG